MNYKRIIIHVRGQQSYAINTNDNNDDFDAVCSAKAAPLGNNKHRSQISLRHKHKFKINKNFKRKLPLSRSRRPLPLQQHQRQKQQHTQPSCLLSKIGETSTNLINNPSDDDARSGDLGHENNDKTFFPGSYDEMKERSTSSVDNKPKRDSDHGPNSAISDNIKNYTQCKNLEEADNRMVQSSLQLKKYLKNENVSAVVASKTYDTSFSKEDLPAYPGSHNITAYSFSINDSNELVGQEKQNIPCTSNNDTFKKNNSTSKEETSSRDHHEEPYSAPEEPAITDELIHIVNNDKADIVATPERKKQNRIMSPTKEVIIQKYENDGLTNIELHKNAWTKNSRSEVNLEDKTHTQNRDKMTSPDITNNKRLLHEPSPSKYQKPNMESKNRENSPNIPSKSHVNTSSQQDDVNHTQSIPPSDFRRRKYPFPSQQLNPTKLKRSEKEAIELLYLFLNNASTPSIYRKTMREMSLIHFAYLAGLQCGQEIMQERYYFLEHETEHNNTKKSSYPSNHYSDPHQVMNILPNITTIVTEMRDISWKAVMANHTSIEKILSKIPIHIQQLTNDLMLRTSQYNAANMRKRKALQEASQSLLSSSLTSHNVDTSQFPSSLPSCSMKRKKVECRDEIEDRMMRERLGEPQTLKPQQSMICQLEWNYSLMSCKDLPCPSSLASFDDDEKESNDKEVFHLVNDDDIQNNYAKGSETSVALNVDYYVSRAKEEAQDLFALSSALLLSSPQRKPKQQQTQSPYQFDQKEFNNYTTLDFCEEHDLLSSQDIPIGSLY